MAISGLLSLSGIDTKPMTRVQMAYKIKEAMDNIEEEKIPYYLSLDREHIIYLQNILYKLIDEFRQELILIGVTTAQTHPEVEKSKLEKIFDFNIGAPVRTEHRFVNVNSGSDMLLENENGIRLEDGYNLRTRAYPWMNVLDTFTFSARPVLRITENDTEISLDEGAAKLSLFNVELSLAKSAMWWGPGFHGAMLMSNNAKPLSLVRIRSINNFKLPWVFSNMGSFGVNFFASKLEEDRNIREPKFVGLRIEYSPLPYLCLGANRTSIMGGKDRPKLDLGDYWKIFMARSADEFSPGEIRKTDTDQLASFDIKFTMPLRPEVRIASGLEVYAEWAGEDRFSFWENESPGLLAGFFLTDLFRDKGTDLRFEYAKNKPAWYRHGLYNASVSGTAYTYEGEIMGHHMGGDADSIFFRISKDVPFLTTPYFDSVKVGAQIDRERHRLNDPIQEEKVEVAFDTSWAHSSTLFFSLRYEFEKYKNFDYVSGKGSENHIFLAEVDMKF
ncbi:MAG: hypothetical protein HQ547_05045 [Candidatus Omnitrophica bacterium]|nr:hypothetical protein [Candidatus Omnitrophota bacterium]